MIATTRNWLDAPVVMVRCFRNRVKMVRVVSESNGVVNVSGAPGSGEIGFPEADVYEFDESLFRQLEAASRRDDADALAALWKRAAKAISGGQTLGE